ncbi:YSIRK-type signal peptide-containing protein, partial [Streptococcus suis]|uniref:YSIRK-type signal peptide-containing protein n=1 Tax=Streptococcus suis TaxID=1307 RepID=UPI0038B83DAB
MSSKDMFRKEQRFSFRKFSFGLASAVIANVIFGGAIASSPIVHANTAEPTSTVVPSERLASVSYTVNVVDQAGTVINTQTKNVSVQTTEATAVATANLTTDLVPEGYALVSGLGQETVTENAENVFTVVVEKATSEVASTEDSAAVSASETSTTAATSEETSTATSETVNSTASAASETSTKATSEVANTAAVAVAAAETVPNKTERTVYLSYITHYVNEANETVDRTGHLVAVTTTDETAKTQVTVSASENMPSGWELVQDKAKVVVQLVENQTNILVFAVTKKSKEEEIAESQLSNRDVLMRLSLEADLLADEALRQVAKEQAGNTALETAANETKAVAATANEVLANTAATEAELDDQIDTVRTSTQNLAAEMLKVDKDGILTAMLDATTQAITITTSSKGAVRPDYENHIRAYATSADQRIYNGQDFFFGLIGKALTEQDSQIRAEAQASDGTTPTISIVGGGGEPIRTISNFGLQDNGSGVLYGTTTISEAGNAFSWKFKASSGNNSAESKFTFVPYTVVKTDNEPVRKAVTAGVTADDILAKVKSDVTRDDGSTRGPLNATFEEYFNSELTARATGKSTTVADTDKTGKQIWHEIKEYVKVAEADGTAVSGAATVTGSLPTEAGTYNVTVLSTNVHGQTIENTVKVILNGAPSMPTIGVNSGVAAKVGDNRQLEVLHVFGNVTGTTEAVSTSGSGTAPDFDTAKATRAFLATDPENETVTLTYGNPGNIATYQAGNPNSLTTYGRSPISSETGNIGKDNTDELLFNNEGRLKGEFPYAPGGLYARIVKMTDTAGNESYSNPFFVVAYTDKLKDDNPVEVNQGTVLTEDNILGKLTIDTTGGVGDTNQSLTVPADEYTRTILGYCTVDGTTKGNFVEQTDLAQFPTDKDLEVKVQTTNVYGQTIYNWVKVDYNLKPKVEIVDAVEGTQKTVYVFSKNNDRTENSEGVTGTNVAFDRNKATKSVVNITDDGQVTRVVYNDGKYDTADMLDKGVTPTTLVGTDGYFTGSVAVPAGTNTTRLLKVTDDKGLVGQSPTFRVYAFSDTVPANVTPVRLAKGTSPALEEITAKMVIDSNSGYPRNPKVEIPKDAYTRTVVGYRLDSSSSTVAVDSVAGLPTEGSYQVRVKTSNAYGQEIYNWVPVSHYKLEEISRDTVNKYTDFPAPIHAITELGSSGTVGTVKLEGDLPADFNIANFNLKEGEAAKLAERNLEFVKAATLGADGTVGTIQTKNGGKVEYTGSGNLEYVFEYTYQVNNTDKTSNLTYTILYTDTQKPIMTPKSEYIRFVDEEYKISVPGTDNAFLNTGKINGSLSVLKDGETGKVSPGLGTNTAIASELDPKGVDVSGGVDNQGGNSTMFNVNITGTAPSAEGTGTYNLRVGENNYPAGPNVERVDGKVPENVGLTPVTVTFVKRAAMTTPVAVVDPANLTADEKAAVIAQLKKDNADNEKLNALPDTAFTVNADGTVSVDYSAGNAGVDAVTDKVANATVKLADAQNEAKAAIDTKLAEEKAAIEAKRDEAIAEINNTPGLTDDQKKAATDAVTNTANDALTDLQTAADDAKKAIDTETTVAGINDAKTAGEKALDDATAKGEAAIELTKEKELAKADVDNQAKDAIEAIKNNPNLDATEQAPYIEAIEKAAEEQKAAIDVAKDTAGITDAVDAAEKVNEEQKLAAAKEDAKDKIAEEAAAAKDAIDKDPNLSDAEKTAAKNAVDAEVAKANDAIDKATTPETV